METMMICNREITVKEYNGERVVTLSDVDTVHQRVLGTAKRNFLQNRDKLVEGVDYHQISKNEIRSLGFVGDTYNYPHGIILLTESGYLMLVKSLRDDLAWMVQRELVNGYFKLRRVVEAVKQMEEPEDEFDTVCRALQIVDKRAKQLEARNTALERKIEQDAPKVAFADAVAESKDAIPLGTMAKILAQTGVDTGRTRFTRTLREMGLMMREGGYLVPTQKGLQKGFFKVTEYPYFKHDGTPGVGITTKITPKGQQYFLELFGGKDRKEA